MRPNSSANLRKGNRELLFRYIILAFLVTALTTVLLVRFHKQQQHKKLQAAVEELAENRLQKDWIGHAIQNMYSAENLFRFFTLTYQNTYFSKYSATLREVAADLDSLEMYKDREEKLGGMMAEKQEKSAVFMNIKRATDSLLTMNTGWDTTRERDIFQPVTAVQFKQKVQVDTIRPAGATTDAPKKKKLFGRLADAVSNKQKNGAPDSAGAVANTRIVRTAITIDSTRKSRNFNKQQLQKIHDYYNGLFKKISAGQANLNRKEYDMIVANDRMLKTLLHDLQMLKLQEADASRQKQMAQTAGIGNLLEKWNRDTLFGSVLVLFMLALILLLIYISYKTSARLNEARLDALRFSKLKSDFVSNMSHEIRTPLSSVIGFTEQLEKTEMRREQEEMVDAIHISANMLLSVVNNVLDFSRLEEGKLKLATMPFSPRQVLEEVTKGMLIQAAQKNISLRERFGFSGGEMVMGDAFRLKQVLVNLVSNAIKFTPDGGAIIIDAVLYSQNGHRSLEVAVNDTGIGISPQQLKHIFEEYTQLPSAEMSPDAPRGSGLGLTIVKKIVDLHGGTLQVESKPGEGSVFRFSIPYKAAEADPELVEPVNPSTPLPLISKVLIVEDNPLNRRLLEMIMEQLQLEYSAASNGVEGLQLIQEQDFDIVFTDIAMPRMDGLTLVRHIRRLEDPKKSRVPVIAITGNVVKEELEMYMHSGFSSYILKPFRETDVVEKINLTRKNGLMSHL